jgi:hypothetical protein
VATQHPSATAAETNSYMPRLVATGLATAAGAFLTSVMDARGTVAGAVVVAMVVSGLSQVMRAPLERRVKSVRAILIIALLGFLVGMGAMHARELARGKMLSLRFARTLLTDLIDEPGRSASSDSAPAVEDAVPTPEPPAKHASSDQADKPATGSVPSDATSPASDTPKSPQSDAPKPADGAP